MSVTSSNRPTDEYLVQCMVIEVSSGLSSDGYCYHSDELVVRHRAADCIYSDRYLLVQLCEILNYR